MNKTNNNNNKILSDSYRSFKEIRTPTELNVNRFKTTSLDSLANSSNNSESLSDDSEGESKSFAVKCEVYGQSSCGSIRSWNKSESSNSEGCYDYVTNDCTEKKTLPIDKRLDTNGVRMETIPEESWCEPKVSVREILARFENLKDTNNKDYNNNHNSHNNHNNYVSSHINHINKNNIININNNNNNNNNNNKDVLVNSNYHQNLGIAITHSATNGNINTVAPAVSSATIPVLNTSVTSLNAKLSPSTTSSSNLNGNSLQSGPIIPNNKKSTGSEISATPNSVKSVNTQAAKEIQLKSSPPPRVPPVERIEAITNNISPIQEPTARPSRREHGTQSPSSPPPSTGKYSLLQFAMHHFRNSSEQELLKMDAPMKPKDKRKEWTWKQQTDLVKWQPMALESSLLRLDETELNPLAVECFDCILRYCGDLPLTPDMSEVKCVYTVLMHCHKHVPLRDEVYCQLMKQTTSNKSDSPESCQRAWRLLSIVAAYFACSETLLPYLTEHLNNAASDRRRICHGTAAVCLSNLRKTQRCGGRKNVPSVEEVTAVSAGRSARRQIYRLPGGAERVVNTRCSTVVADVISELCSLIGVTSEAEQQEFSLYCIVQGDAFTMPLAADEYILDVTTELHKASHPFYLIFCRSVWYHPLKHDASPLYTEVLFNQVAPDYLEGLLLRLGSPNLPPSIIRDMSLIAALLHRAADLNHSPTLKEVKFLLPKPILGLREPRPPQWLALVQTSWGQASGLQVSRAKHRVLQVLSNWQLFGSSFFAVKRVTGELDNWQEHILALNRTGVHFLDMMTHETIQHWPYAEVISTRKVRSEDGALFLDMKCGNLLQQRVTRLQTEQAHEISRLVRQYINLEQLQSSRSPK